jgi:hypothetical protein
VAWPYVVRQHWIVLIRPPHRWTCVLIVVLAVAGFLRWYSWVVLLAVLVGIAVFRFQEWRAERIEFDRLTVRRVRGVAESTSTDAMLRIDRIVGIVLTRTVPGKLLGYGTIHLESSGGERELRWLINLQHPVEVYRLLESLMFPGASRNGPALHQGHTVPLPELLDGPEGYPRDHPDDYPNHGPDHP